MELTRRVIKSEVRSINEDNFSVDVIMSDETIDRYHEIILASAWVNGLKNYKAHPVLLSSHSYHGLMNQIGEASKIGVVDGSLVTTFKYYVNEQVKNPEADWGWVLASKGVAAYSVGFMRKKGFFVDENEKCPEEIEPSQYKKWIKAGVQYVYTEVELLECSHVLVPANPVALQNSIDQGEVVRSLEEKAFPMLVDLETALKSLHKDQLSDEVKKIDVSIIDGEEFTMKEADFEKMVETVQQKLSESLNEKIASCMEIMVTTFKNAIDEVLAVVKETSTQAVEDAKEVEIKETVGDEKADEFLEEESIDKVKAMFDSITSDIKKTFNVQS